MMVIAAGSAGAQGRGGAIWTTEGYDAQRTSWVKNDPKISKDALSKPGFQFLWKRKLENQPRGLNSLTQPVFSAPGFITYKGFKALAYLGGAGDDVYSIDYDLNRMFWTSHLKTAATAGGTAACPGGLTSITMSVPLPMPAAAQTGGRAAGARGGGGGGFGGGRGGNGVYVVSSGGMAHSLNAQTGEDLIAPVKLLPSANARIAGSIFVNDVLYVATADNCGGVPNGVYSIDLAPVPAPARGAGPPPLPTAPNLTPASTAVTSWRTNGGGVVGRGPAVGTDSTVYVATGDGDQSATALSDAVVALDSRTLAVKDYFMPGKTPFTSSPVIFQFKGKDLIVAANKDGRLYVLDSASLGGSDHKTPLAKTAPYANGSGDFAAGALSTFEEADGTRWVLVPAGGPASSDTKYPTTNGAVTNGAIAAFKLVDSAGALTLQPAWISRDMTTPATPSIVNGVVFALATGENTQVPAGQRAQRSSAAVLYALDAQTGKELWNSGTSIASFVHGIGPAANDSQVYVMGYDGTVYVFGWVVER
jgi:hypothetical protein